MPVHGSRGDVTCYDPHVTAEKLQRTSGRLVLRTVDTHGVAIGSYSRYVFLFFGSFITTHSTLYVVPIAVGLALLQSSLYDVPGGFRAVMFDRFSGVKNQVCL